MTARCARIVVGCVVWMATTARAWPAVALHPPVVCIDPGHPSETSRGTRGRSGTTEIRVNWEVALRLAKRLRSEGMDVLLTKSSEGEWVSNRRRAEIADAAHAALFLRLHCESVGGPGTAIYYPDRAGRSGGRRGPSPDVIRRSRAAALRFHRALRDSLGPSVRDRGVHADSRTRVGRRQGALTGSIYSGVPVLTVEMWDLSDLHDERLAASSAGQDRWAAALDAGVRAAVQRTSGPGYHSTGAP